MLNNEIVGLIVTEIKPYSKCEPEDNGLLCDNVFRVVYILTIGVIHNLRRHGIATILIKKLIENLTVNPLLEDCKAIYLHVLSTNTVAISFYEKLLFKRHKYLPNYYCINHAVCDGYSYVHYLNGGKPPFNFIQILNLKRTFLLISQYSVNICKNTPNLLKWNNVWCLYSFVTYCLPLKWVKKYSQNFITCVYRKLSFSPIKQQTHLYTC